MHILSIYPIRRRVLVAVLFICGINNAGFTQRGKLIQNMMERRLDNEAAPNTGPAPDYANLYYWAASPFKHDCSDSIPSFLKDEERDSLADVFFIHPTTFITMQKAAWNADLSDTALNRDTDLRPILYQASVFNGSCRVFAPRYRQANLKAFLVRETPRAKEAFDVAYNDIRNAFQYYLDHDNHGRPIVIASHSQGSYMAIRLLQEFFDGKPLQQQLVCAYVIGYQIEKNAFKTLPWGNSPYTTGCVVGWRSFQKQDIPYNIQAENGNSLCTNPLTWTSATAEAPKELNKGSMTGFNTIRTPGVATSIDPQASILWVTLPDDIDSKIKQMKNLHVLDYNLFWMNIRKNVQQRITAYLATHPKA